ncbi:hypothetical protein FRC11_000706 [Ceratobasidium sp. 423]|nr:hypothetical protein FRC11_000706 [Ceratobasidium sp. 423]
MGSNIITDRLEIMYVVTQHLVHIIAGTKTLEQYTCNKQAKDESDHLFAIFTHVLGKKALNHDGKPGNGALKILVHIWSEYQALEQGLLDHDIKTPKTTLPEEYQRLVDGDQAWWTLLSIFKMSKFEKGLGIEVTPKFGPGPQSPKCGSLSEPVHLAQSSTSLELPTVQLEAPGGDDDLTLNSTINMGASSSEGIGGGDPEHTVSQPVTKVSKPKNVAGRKRGRDEGANDDEDYVSQSVGKRVTRSQSSVSHADGTGSKDKVLDEQINRLTDRARRMDSVEAGSVASLLSALQELEGPMAVEVNQMLCDMMPKVIAKAQKRGESDL